MKFEWDEDKAASNRVKHGIDFEDAILALFDPKVIELQDRVVRGEERWQAIGMAAGVILLVAFAYGVEGESLTTRIISARRANKEERSRYNEQS